MVEKSGCALSVRRQCELPGVNRNWLESGRDGTLSSEEQVLARRIDEVHFRFPEFGARRMSLFLSRVGLRPFRYAPGASVVTCRSESLPPNHPQLQHNPSTQ